MSSTNWQTVEVVLESMTAAEKLELIERVARSLRAPGPANVAQQQEAIARLQERCARLPIQNPDDGFSSSDHDRVLYGADQ